MTALSELLLHRDLTRIKYLTSRALPDKEVKEITVMEVPEVGEWLNGNELVLTSLYALKDDIQRQVRLIEELSSTNCSGLLVKLGPHVKVLDKRVIQKAEELELPILVVPKNMTYVEVIGTVMRKIAEDEEDTITIENFFTKILLEAPVDVYEKKVIRNFFDIRDLRELNYFCLITKDRNFELTNMGINPVYKLKYGDYKIDILVSKDTEMLKNIRDKAIRKLEEMKPKDVILGFIRSDPMTFLNDFRELTNLLEEYIKIYDSSREGLFLKSDIEEKIWRYKYFNSVGKKYYDKYLASLEVEDYNTLSAYLENDLNIADTSKALFLHKNTIRYRLNQIEEKTGINLQSLEEIFYVHCALTYMENEDKDFV